MSCLETISLHDCCDDSRQRDGGKGKIYPQHIRDLIRFHIQILMRYYNGKYKWKAHFRKIFQNDMKNNSISIHFNDSESNDSFSKSRIYILPKNNLNKNYFRFIKVTSTNQKERRKSTSHAEGNEGVPANRAFKNTDCEVIRALCGWT